MHVHLREPGHEYKETIESGTKAAVYGGFTAVCCMPNTQPVNDNRQVTEFIIEKAREAKNAKVYPVGAISRGLNGRFLCEYGEQKEAGIIALSDDGCPVRNNHLMRRAMEYAKSFGLLVISHCEDLDMVADGVMNEGKVSTRLGLKGIPNAAESIMVKRDVELSELTQVPVHIAHVSTEQSVEIIRSGKKRGIPVTAETAPHYFVLTDEDVGEYNTNAKMNPPLRSQRDREAIKEGLADGTIDVIASDHAPHSSIEKDVEFDQAANGIIGLETSLSISLKLVQDKVLSIQTLIEKMSKKPARILGINRQIRIGEAADLTIIDLEAQTVVDANRFQSLSRNTPFSGWELQGRAVFTIVNGRVVFEASKMK
jgi:dihydroorotase